MHLGLDYRPVTAAPYSGIARQVLAMEAAIASLGQDKLVRFTAAPADHPHRRSAICPDTDLPSHGLHRPRPRLHFEARFLPAVLRQERIEVYIATANRGLPIGLRPRRWRQVLLLHDLFQLSYPEPSAHAWKRQAYLAIERISIWHSLRQADRIWCPSRYTLETVAGHFPRHAHKLRLLPNAVAPLPAMTPPKQPLPPRYWLAVGTCGERKNIARLIKAWQTASRCSLDVPALVLVGSPLDLPAALRALPGLEVRQAVSDDVLAWLYRHAECLWHPAQAEGFGLPVVEALAQGLAVATAQGSALDEVTPAQAPRFDPHSMEAIASLMLALGSDPLSATAEAAAQRRTFAAAFAPAAYAARLRELLEELRR